MQVQFKQVAIFWGDKNGKQNIFNSSLSNFYIHCFQNLETLNYSLFEVQFSFDVSLMSKRQNHYFKLKSTLKCIFNKKEKPVKILLDKALSKARVCTYYTFQSYINTESKDDGMFHIKKSIGSCGLGYFYSNC